jgi:hypothetical protein
MTKSINRIHARIVFGGVILLLGFVAWLYVMDGARFITRAAR